MLPSLSAARRTFLTSALAAVGLPVEVPATPRVGLVVQIVEIHEGGGRVEVRGYELVTTQVLSGGRGEALDAVAGVLEALGYTTRRAVLGSVVFTIPAEVAADEDYSDYCAPEGGRPCMPPGAREDACAGEEDEDTAPMSLAAVELYAAAMAVGL